MSPSSALLLPSPHPKQRGGAVASAAAMAAVDAQDKDGWTALHAAAYAADTRCVALLLKAGAAARVVDGSGQSPVRPLCPLATALSLARDRLCCCAAQADVATAQGAPQLAAVLRGEVGQETLEVGLDLEAPSRSASASSGGRQSKDGKFRSPSPAPSALGKGDVESGLLGGDAIAESSESSDEEVLDPMGAISRTGRASGRRTPRPSLRASTDRGRLRAVSRLTPEEKEEVRDLETAMDIHPRRQCAKMVVVTFCLCALLGVPIVLLVMAFAGD